MADRDIFKLLELVAIFVCIGGILAWELWSVRPERKPRQTPPEPPQSPAD